MKRYRFACIWLSIHVVGASIWGCEPTGKKPASPELCIELADGASKCLAFGGDSILLLEKSKAGLEISLQSAKGLIAAPQNGNPSDAAGLAEGLQKSQAAFSFDPKQEKIKWQEHQLIIESAKGDLPKRIYQTDNAMSILLLQPDKLGPAYGAFLGKAHCATFFDVDHLVDSLSEAQGSPAFVAFTALDGIYYAGAIAVDGGLTIIVVDPTIIDNDWRVVTGLRLTRDFGWEGWSAERTGRAARPTNAYFVPIAETLPDYSPDSSGAAFEMHSSGDIDPSVRRAYAGLGVENFELLCKIRGKCQIELCDSTFHFWQDDLLVQEIPQFPCAIGIRRSEVTEIFKFNRCEWGEAVGLPCAR